MQLGDLEVLATLGMGGFGRVELVRVKNSVNAAACSSSRLKAQILAALSCHYTVVQHKKTTVQYCYPHGSVTGSHGMNLLVFLYCTIML